MQKMSESANPAGHFVYITGERVLPSQAQDIIYLTDPSITSFDEEDWGTNYEFLNKRVRNVRNGLEDNYGIHERMMLLRASQGVLNLKMIPNELISCYSTIGANTWIYPDGKISGCMQFVENELDVDKLLSDCECIAQRFPFLKMTVTVGEGKFTYPVMLKNHVDNCVKTIVIKEGVVECVEDHLSAHYADVICANDIEETDVRECYLDEELVGAFDERIIEGLNRIRSFTGGYRALMVTGEAVSHDMAVDIITATDPNVTLFHERTWGNNKRLFRERFVQIFRKVAYSELVVAQLRKILGVLSLGWLSNSLITSRNGKPKSWIHPNGEIYLFDNVRYPSVDGLEAECISIAERFPTLNMTVTLFSEPTNSPTYLKSGVITFTIKQGKVERHRNHFSPHYNNGESLHMEHYPGCYIPHPMLNEIDDKIRNTLQNILDWERAAK